MTTVEEIKKAILNKIKLVTGNEFIFKEEYDSQLIEIRSNFILACEQANSIEEWNWIEWFEEPQYQEEFKKKNDLLSKYYKRTNSWVEEWWWKNYHEKENFPIGLYFEFTSEKWEHPKIKTDQQYFWNLMKNIENYIKSEQLEEVNRFYINIFNTTSNNQTVYNIENSFKGNSDIGIIIVLISDRRIIRLVINDKELVSSKENVIQKDLKKIEILNTVNIYFHYHGLHEPDLLVIDNYEVAVELRRVISELREPKFLNKR